MSTLGPLTIAWLGLRTDLPPRLVKPTLVVEMEYKQRTSDGLRHAVLRGIRPDRKAREVKNG